MLTRSKKLKKNTISSVILQFVGIISALILPKLILKYYGSEVNGLVNSISQFLSIITFLELGVGAVVQSSLYKPLAENDYVKQSQIYISAQKFFSTIAKILLGYIVVLIFIYPYITNFKFDFIYTATLIIAIGISSFAQYYFGLVNSLLVSADQRGYIQYDIQIITIVANTVCCIILMRFGVAIQFVKLSTSIIYLARPLYLNYYVKQNYKIDRTVSYNEEPIKQKWNGVAQHVAAIILDGTDTIVLTIFATLKDVSIYSVYYLVVSGIKTMFNALTNGVQALLGDSYARDSKSELIRLFSLTEWVIHSLATIIFGITCVLITPFVILYTRGINDANYNRLVFGYIISFAYAAYCYRLPYHIMVRASGQYRETQSNYIISAALNLVSSILLVKNFGLNGVAIGTLIAMLFQALWLSYYNAKNILNVSLKSTIKQFLIDLLVYFIGIFLCKNIHLGTLSITSWLIMALKACLLWLLASGFLNIIFYRSNLLYVIKRLKR